MTDAEVIAALKEATETILRQEAETRRFENRMRRVVGQMDLLLLNCRKRSGGGNDMPLTKAQRKVLEQTTAQYTATLTDETGTAIPLADLTTLTLTLYNEATGAIINSRNAQDVKNTNGVTVHATSGLLTWTMTPSDNVIVDTSLVHGDTELHIARFDFTWNGGAKTGRHIVLIEVEQLKKVT